MIPDFPAFKKLKIEDKSLIENYIKKFPPYSDFNFVSLWSYNTEDDILISNLNGNLIVRMRDYLTGEPFYTLLGEKKIAETVLKLLDKAKKEKISVELKLISEHSVKTGKLTDNFRFKVEEDFDNHDYIVSLPKLKDLQGTTFYQKKRLVNKFKQSYPQHKVIRLDLNDRDTQLNMTNTFLIWEQERKKSKKDTEHEFKAIKRLLKQAENFNLLSLGIFQQNKLIGFSITEQVQINYAMGHFMKAAISYKGIVEALYNYTARHLLAKGSYYLNLEQDMGIEGLRIAKSLWRPVHYLKKYKISLRK